MKGTYELHENLEENKTYGIVNTKPGQFEVYILSNEKENEIWETDPYIKEHPIEE